MDLNKLAVAALFSGLALSPTAALAFGADVQTNPNFQSGEVSAELINKVKAKRLQAIKDANCSALSESTSCSDHKKDESDGDETETIAN